MSAGKLRRCVRLAVAGVLVTVVGARSVQARDDDKPEPVTKLKGEVGDYLRAIHARVHKRWAKNFAFSIIPESNPFNDKSKRVVIRFVVAEDGAIKSSEVVTRSGLPELDDLASAIVKESGPWPRLPASAVSDDGNGYFEWAFSRDYRLCGDIKPVPRQDPIEDAVPRYLGKRKDAEAWKRVQEVAKGSPDPVLAWFARLWLTRALGDPETAAAAAAGLLAAGDSSGLAIVKSTLQKGAPGTPLAALAMTKAKLPVCPLVRDNLVKEPGAAQDAALAALRFGLDKDCIAGVGQVAGNGKVPLPTRMTALRMLSESPEPAALEALGALKNDPAPGVKGAALLASVKPGVGRSAVFRLIPYLKDSNVEVRAAASAGVVRAAGDAELGQLYLLFRESDPRPYEMVATELGKYATSATAALLAKMLKKEDKRVRLAAAAAVAGRSDPFVAPLLETLAKDPDPELKMIGLLKTGGKADSAGRQLMAAEPAQARRLYRQMVVGSGRASAAEWLLARFSDLDAVAKVEVLGEWLVGAPPGAATATFSSTQP